MNLELYRTLNGSLLSFSREQASAFAKEIAGDFNPIHNVDARRFCVPGDLLFVTMLLRYGLAERTVVEFSNMVDDSMQFELPEDVEDNFELQDTAGKACLSLSLEGRRFRGAALAESLSERYVTFSGKTFPDILVNMMKEHQVMINGARPLVMYKSMSVNLVADAIEGLSPEDATGLSLELDSSEMVIEGKKASATLLFRLSVNEQTIGEGNKTMLLGGLREYDQTVIDDIVRQYNQWKSDYSGKAANNS